MNCLTEARRRDAGQLLAALARLLGPGGPQPRGRPGPRKSDERWRDRSLASCWPARRPGSSATWTRTTSRSPSQPAGRAAIQIALEDPAVDPDGAFEMTMRFAAASSGFELGRRRPARRPTRCRLTRRARRRRSQSAGVVRPARVPAGQHPQRLRRQGTRAPGEPARRPLARPSFGHRDQQVSPVGQPQEHLSRRARDRPAARPWPGTCCARRLVSVEPRVAGACVRAARRPSRPAGSACPAPQREPAGQRHRRPRSRTCTSSSVGRRRGSRPRRPSAGSVVDLARERRSARSGRRASRPAGRTSSAPLPGRG